MDHNHPSDEQEDDLDLGMYSLPTSASASSVSDHSGRSRRLGQQRIDFNISPPTIPRSDTANIFTGGAFASASASSSWSTSTIPTTTTSTSSRYPNQYQDHTHQYLQQHQYPTQSVNEPQRFVQGQIPSYHQGEEPGAGSQYQEGVPSQVQWQQSRILPTSTSTSTAQLQSHSHRHFFTPLHIHSTNEESKFATTGTNTNPISPAGVTSPGFHSFASPSYPRMVRQQQQHQQQVPVPVPLVSQLQHGVAALSPPPPTPSTSRPISAPTLGTAISSDSVDSETRRRQRRNKKSAISAAQRNVKTPTLQELMITPTQIEDKGPSPSPIPGSKSPPAQNLRGDPFRSAKVKTEICRHYNTPKGCPFGDKCNYAHGEHELKYTKLMDLERAGLVDIEIFRTHPCPTWVATGAW